MWGTGETIEEALVRLERPQTALDAFYASHTDWQGVYQGDDLIDVPWGPDEIEPDPDDAHFWGGLLEYELDQERLEREFHEAMVRAEAPVAAAPLQQVRHPKGTYFKKPIPAKLRWAVFRRDGYRCVVCGCDEDLTADHIVAEVKGGKATISNLRTLCRPCNSKKGAR